MKLDTFDWIAIIMVIIGALNWGLVGLLSFDLVQFIFGEHFISRVLYGLVGLSGIYFIYLIARLKK